MQIKNSLKGQVYLVIIFELIITATVFFFLTFPLLEQAKGIAGLLDSYTALNNAESGLEIALFNKLKDPSVPILSQDFEIIFSDNKIESVGKGKFTERTLFYGQ